MNPSAEPVEESPGLLAWFRQFLKEELAPYPGRDILVARMVIAATVSMLITMTFRLPFGVLALSAFNVSRETHWATIKAMREIGIAVALADLYVIIGMIICLGDPLSRMLWVTFTFFLVFFAISIVQNYPAAASFGFLIALTIPLLDQHISTELKVEQALWAAGQALIAAGIAALAAVFFVGLKPGYFFVRHITEQLTGVEDLLHCCAAGRPVDEKTAKNITRLVMLGTSELRRIVHRAGLSEHDAERMGLVVALVGRLVDLAGGLAALDLRILDEDAKRMQTLAQAIARLRADLVAGRIPEADEFPTGERTCESVPILPHMERTLSLIVEAFAGSQQFAAFSPALRPEGEPPQRFIARDALSNPEHVKFALRGCLAASLCYLIYTGLVWPGISTAIVICVLTALTTTGGSRQNQILRFVGVLLGAVAGVIGQVLVLPGVDSIVGFTLFFVVVTFVAAWINASSPRLLYVGFQMALTYFFINLQEFRIQVSLLPARDRVIGTLLGLVMMWLAFDQLWTAPTIVQMKKTFISLFRLLAELDREPVSDVPSVALEKTLRLRATINSTFSRVRSLADAVWFEFGLSRQRDLALRKQIIGRQILLRTMFITRVSLLKYRLQFPDFELPETIRASQIEFDQSLARALDGMADHVEGKSTQDAQSVEASLTRLKEIADTCDSTPASGIMAVHLRSFIPLLRRTENLANSLFREIFAQTGDG